MFENIFCGKVAVITGAAGGIGKTIADEFTRFGAHVCIIDIKENPYFVGDISKKEVLHAFADKVIADYGHIDYLINNALPLMRGIEECTYEEFEYAQRVGVTAPFYLTKLFLPYFGKDAAIVNISSSRDRMSQPNTESYTAAKGGISALTHALAVSLGGRVRVNSVSPGVIETELTRRLGSTVDSDKVPMGRMGQPAEVAEAVVFLASDMASYISGQNIRVNGGQFML